MAEEARVVVEIRKLCLAAIGGGWTSHYLNYVPFVGPTNRGVPVNPIEVNLPIGSINECWPVAD